MTLTGKVFTFGLKAVLVSLALLMAGGAAYAQGAPKKIGILIWASESRYEIGAKAFVEQMKQEGFGPAEAEIIIRRTDGNKATAMVVADELAAQKLDLYFSLGTSGTKAMARVIKDVPLVFSTVYDPVEAGFVQGWDSSMNNITGASSFVPMDKVLLLASRIIPLKSVAVLYTPNEKNSEAQLKDLQQAQSAMGLTVVPVAIVNAADVAAALPFLAGQVQAIFVTGSIVVGKSIPEIISFASKEKILTITHLEDLVAKGLMIGFCADLQQQGILAGKLAGRILKGVHPKDVPIEKATEFSILINKASATSAGIVIPPEVLQQAKKVIE